MTISVLLFGHSFVSRFKQHLFLQNHIIHLHPGDVVDYDCSSMLNVNFSSHKVIIKGVPGLKIHQAIMPTGPLLSLVLQHSPDLVILDVGANDLDSPKPENAAQSLATYLQNLADALTSTYGVKRVIFTSIILRTTGNKPKSHTTPRRINDASYAVNIALRQFSKPNPSKFQLWNMKGLATEESLENDGLHPNYHGFRHYMFNVRKMITSSRKIIES